MQVNKYILTYEQIYKAGIEHVGTKAYNVAFYNNAGFRIPKSIVLSNQAFKSFLNGDNLEESFLAIKDYFSSYRNLIVRSSALEEDKDDISFAGQYLSVICLNKDNEIKKACEACWESYSSANVKAYQKAMKAKHSEYNLGMALLIQNMVNASSSGVCFTSDPLKNRKDIIVINAVRGLGEVLANGEAVSDHYDVDARRGNIISRITGEQTHWRSPESPQELNPVPREFLGKSALTENQIGQVAQMAQEVSKLYKKQVDIEWAYEGDKLFLLQARPITKLDKDSYYEKWTRDNVADVIPDVVTPLTWSVVNEATNEGFKKVVRKLGFPPKPVTLFNVFDGRVYFNQMAYSNLTSISPEKKRNPAFLLKTGVYYLFLLASIEKEVRCLTDSFNDGLSKCLACPKISTLRKLKKYLEKYMDIHIRVAVLMELGFLIIRKMIGKSTLKEQGSELIDGLVTGLKEIESIAPGESLWEFACMIRNNKALSEAIMNSPESAVPDILNTYGEIYSEKWQQFLKHYGHSALKEFEIYYPRWIEDPSFIVSTLKQYISKGADIDPEANKTLRADKRRESERKLFKSTPLIYHLPLKFYINHVRQCSIWRESIKQKIVKIMAEIRKLALDFAEEYAVDPLENIFFLTLEEICQIKNHALTPDLFEKIETRKKDREKWEIQQAFKEIRVYPNGRQMKIPYLTGDGDSTQGLALSSGKCSGIAKVIMDPTQINCFNFGDILVTRSTNPSWTPLFILAGAIVTDMGNYLSHGAIVARELGIPAVGNLFDATKRIKNGQAISVDGDNGIVYLH